MDLLEAYQESNAFGRENELSLHVISPGHIEYTMPIRNKHLALAGVIHGGVVAGLMDAVLSVAAFTAVKNEGNHVATVEFKINYLQPASVKGSLKGIGKVIRKGKRILVTEGEIRDQEGNKVAVALGTIASVQWKKT